MSHVKTYSIGSTSGVIQQYCARQAWMVKRREGRSTRCYCTPSGVKALKQFGIEILPPDERKGKSRSKRLTN